MKRSSLRVLTVISVASLGATSVTLGASAQGTPLASVGSAAVVRDTASLPGTTSLTDATSLPDATSPDTILAKGAQRAAVIAAEQRRDDAAAARGEAERLVREQAQRMAAEQAATAAREQAQRDQAAQEAASRSSSRGGGAKAIGADLVAARGWSSAQFDCLDRLWTKESGWKVSADNPSSSAYGIPQALPGAKMASAGSDWQTNPHTQITWGLGYIEERYGSPCGAWSHSRSHNWY